MNTLLGYSYQDGGDVPSAYQRSFGFSGGTSPTFAALLRKREKARSQDEYEDILREEAKKREQASIFGGAGSFIGSLALPAIMGATGAAIPFWAALGGYGGKKMGASAGYSGFPSLFSSPESEDYGDVMEDKDLIYGKRAFEGLGKSARDYARRGIDQDAIVSGLKAGAGAAFGGDDSMYARAGKRNLFTPQVMPEVEPTWSMDFTDYLAGAEEGDYGEFTKYKKSFGMPDYRRNLLDYMNIGTSQPFDITNPLTL